MRNLSVPHVPVVLNLSLGNCSLLRTGAVAVWELLEKEGRLGQGAGQCREWKRVSLLLLGKILP